MLGVPFQPVQEGRVARRWLHCLLQRRYERAELVGERRRARHATRGKGLERRDGRRVGAKRFCRGELGAIGRAALDGRAQRSAGPSSSALAVCRVSSVSFLIAPSSAVIRAASASRSPRAALAWDAFWVAFFATSAAAVAALAALLAWVSAFCAAPATSSRWRLSAAS